jgi:hypothetical protein
MENAGWLWVVVGLVVLTLLLVAISNGMND